MQLATPQGSVTLRQAQLSDVENFRTLRLEALRNHPAAFGADYELNAAKPMSYWEERIASPADQGTIYFAEYAQSLIGMCGVQRDSSPKTMHTAWIWGVYVVEEWRGFRVAETLIEECRVWAEEHGVRNSQARGGYE